MVRATPEEREFRSELLRHINRMHGGLTIVPGEPKLELATLEKMHEMMHTDGYACPPHEHKNPGPYDLGKIKLTLGKKYLETIRKVASGDLG